MHFILFIIIIIIVGHPNFFLSFFASRFAIKMTLGKSSHTPRVSSVSETVCVCACVWVGQVTASFRGAEGSR